MKRTKNIALFGMCAAGAVFLASCASPVYSPLSRTPGAIYKKGVMGGTVVESYQLTGTVVAIDPIARTLSLLLEDGRKAMLRCESTVAHLDQLRAGDRVTAIVKDELSIAMDDGTAAGDSVANPARLSPKAAEPGELVAATQHYTATIEAINLKRHQVTLRFPDGVARLFETRKDVDLTRRRPGERVAFRVTVGTAIAVMKL